jgi:ribonucleotide reductase alpha subunit
MKQLNCLLYILLICQVGFSQIGISGIIKDKNTQQGIPFASIGIQGKQSTLSDVSGNFELSAEHITDTDSVHIFSIGYGNLSLIGSEFKKSKSKVFYLKPMMYDLDAVEVKSKNTGYKILGTRNYSKDVCTAFAGENNNWLGEQVAIQANNKEGAAVYLESFGFYIIKNEYKDSLQFRIMLYEAEGKGYPGNTFLKRPILFKTNIKQGEVRIDLSNYALTATGDFFISLECLEQKMEASKFCFAGSIKVPSFVKTSPLAEWHRVKGGGGDFNVKVSYIK